MDIKIKKAKLSKGGSVEVTYIDPDGNEINMKGYNKCHPDLRDAFARLVPFFADLTEQKEADHIDWGDMSGSFNVDLLRRLTVCGVSISGYEGSKIVTLTGNRTLLTSRILNLNSPGVEMDSETYEWDHIDDFDIALSGVIYEVKEYITNRKWEVVQPQLNFDDNPDDPFGGTAPTDDAPPLDPVENVA